MDTGTRTTGTRDEHYDLVSVLYHALKGADACDRYALDAETTGDEQLVGAFFRETQTMHTQVAERAKALLGIIEVPAEGDVPPEPPPGDFPPRPRP